MTESAIHVCRLAAFPLARQHPSQELNLDLPLQLFLQLVEVNMFERVSLQQMINNALPDLENRPISSQLDLF